MVLTRPLAAALLVLASCVTAHQAARSPARATVAAAFVVDAEDAKQPTELPKTVADELRAALDARNLEAQPLDASAWSGAFASKRATAMRLQHLAQTAPRADLILLVETKAVFYSLLNGRYRWMVNAKATLAKRTALGEALTTTLDFPVFLDFDHQREPDALAAASSLLADQVGRLADQYIGAATPEVPAKTTQTAPRVGPADSIYFVMVDRFSNGDPTNDGDIDPNDPEAFHGGDLQGVLNKLDYIQGLGFTTIWLSPVFKMRTAKLDGHGAFHGYWVEDFARIVPRFGDEALLKKLADELHQRKMKLLLDVVLNHVGYETPLAAQHPDWFHHNGDIKDWDDAKQLESNDVHGLPDLAQEKEEVYQYLLSTSLKWIDEVHPDGFRLDAVKHVPLAFWARYNDDIRRHAGADFFLLGEDLEGNPEKLARTMKEGKFTSVFDFPLYFAAIDVFCKGAPAGKLAATLSQDEEYAAPDGLVTLLDNHDLPRLDSACGHDAAKVRSALKFLLGTRGIPAVMYGTEAGLSGSAEPSNRGDMRFDAPAFANDLQGALALRRASPPARNRLLSTRIETIVVSGAPVAAGDELRLAGTSRDLGFWDPTRGLGPFKARPSAAELVASADLPVDAAYEFKLAIVRADGSIRWESRANRYARAGSFGHLTWDGPDDPSRVMN
jgi:hypothetical protein